jgi:ribosomal small subunit protein bTHX
MGKGDKKSKKGKRFQHSFGKTRKRKKGLTISSRKKVEQKPKPVEHKKPVKPEPELVKPVVVVQPKVDEIAFKLPEVSEIKQEVEVTKITEEPIAQVPEIVPEAIVTKIKVEEPVHLESKVELPVEEKTTQEVPKKRGRPKKKKEE